MRIQHFVASSAFALAIAFASAPANAAVVVDTGEPLVGEYIYDLNVTQSLAARFTVTTTTRLTDLTGYMFAYSTPGTFTIAVRADGENPGAELFSGTATANLSFAFYGVHGVSWLVGPGSYWLAFEVRPGDTMDGYMPDRQTSPIGPESYYGNGAWERYDELDIGVRISGDAVAAVPEPAAWALMLTGFLGAGAALRVARRRQAVLTP